MFKRLIIFTSIITLLFYNSNYLLADNATIIPLKKPTLSEKEIQKKISINILKPLKKPKKK